MDLKDAIKIGVTPVMDEKNIFPDILKDHMTPKGKWGLIVVEKGSLEYEWKDTGEVLKGDREHSILIEPERLHRVILTGPVKFKVEFYKFPDEELKSVDTTVLRPGENFLDKK